MGKASSSKKVARAAGTSGGRTTRGRTPWLYYLILGLVVILGSAMVYTSRHHRLQVIDAGGTATPPQVGDHLERRLRHLHVHRLDKGKFVPPITDRNNPHGIWTPTNGVIEVSPKSDSVAGKNATLDKFSDAVHMVVNAGELKVPGGKDLPRRRRLRGQARPGPGPGVQQPDRHDGHHVHGRPCPGPLPGQHPPDHRLHAQGGHHPAAAEGGPRQPGRGRGGDRGVDLDDRRSGRLGATAGATTVPGATTPCRAGDHDAGGHDGAGYHDAVDRTGSAGDYRQAVKAVVLVGGEGTRLQPLTLTTPKQMLPVAGRPMIERVVGHLAGYGIDEVVLSLGYRPAAFLTAYPDGRCAGVELVYAVEPEPLDTAGAIGFAARYAGIDDTFVVVNGDVSPDSTSAPWSPSTAGTAPRPPSPSPRSTTRRATGWSPPTPTAGSPPSSRSRPPARRRAT